MTTGTHQPAISVRSLVKRYGDREVVSDIDLEVESGTVFGLLGPNGAGKTTAVEMIAGLRLPTDGLVRVLGLDPATEREQLTKSVSVQPQEANLFPTLTVVETLDLFASFYEHPRTTDEVVDSVGLESSRHIRVANLSGGQARRLLVGVAIVGQPQLVILDEPSAGLDPAARRELWKLVRALRDEGVTLLLTTHHMDEAMELCDQLAILVFGRIVAMDTPEQLVAEHAATSRGTFKVPSGTEPAEIACALGDEEAEATPVSDALLVRIDTAEPDALLRRITMHRGFRATNIRVESASLEDVFLKLAGETDLDWGTDELDENR